MASEQEFSRKLQDIGEEWKRITATPNPPRSLMNVIEYGLGEKKRGEVYVTRLLRYLMDSSESHGMDDEFLKAFLEGFATRFRFEESIHDLSNVRVRKEVWIRKRDDMDRSEPSSGIDDSDESEGNDSPGRVDLVVDKPGDWFLLIELKFSAEENNLAGSRLSQTEFYREASHIGETPKAEYEGRHSYLYLHKAGADPAVDEKFVNWTWEDVTSDVIKPFINTLGSSIPHRTLVHLNELRDDIENFTGMTPDEPHAEEKVELYLEHYTILNDLHRSFEDRWKEFTNQWNSDLSVALDEYIDTYYEVDEGIVAVDFDNETSDSTWYFRAKHKDWQQIYRDGWYKPENEEQWNNSELESLHKKATDHDTFRIFYHHRMDTNRDAAIEDNTLIFTFRNALANPKPFYDKFDEEFEDRKHDLAEILPESTEWLGRKSDQFEVRYEIPDPDPDNESAPDDFFDAYTSTLRTAFVELVVENSELTDTITEIYDEAIEEHMNCIRD